MGIPYPTLYLTLLISYDLLKVDLSYVHLTKAVMVYFCLSFEVTLCPLNF